MVHENLAQTEVQTLGNRLRNIKFESRAYCIHARSCEGSQPMTTYLPLRFLPTNQEDG